MAIDNLQEIWPEWQVEGKPLGKGSFGVVYKAVRRDHNVESYAAIKVISIPSDSSEVDSLRSEGLDMNASKTYFQGIVNDFVSEIQLMESLKGVQNIVSVEDYKVVEKIDEIGWDIYIRMELLTSFNTYICDKKLAEEEVIKLGCDICTALEICGQRNIIHRDIKPENIFINDFGHFKLGDFGIARKMENITGGLSQKGTFNYMAPEVATSNDYDARVDTYSLGIVLYRLLNCNRLPFLETEKQFLNPNERRNAVDRRLRGEKLPVPCDASPAMANLILRACAYDPNMRFTSATEMKQALMRVINGTYQATVTIKQDGIAPAKKASANNRTNTISKAPAASTQKSRKSVNTFGAAPKKKRKLPAIVASVLTFVILVGIGIVVIPKLINNSDSDNSSDISGKSTSSKTTKSSQLKKEQIASIISEAEILAEDEDYEGALSEIKTGLITYPESKALQEKEIEYADALSARIKENTLKEANNLIESGDFVSAIVLIRNAQDTIDEDPDYTNAYNTYCTSYKDETVKKAKNVAKKGDYIGAIELLQQTISIIGSDIDVTNLIQTYEDAYEAEILSESDQFLKKNQFDKALDLLNEGLNDLPNNTALVRKISEVTELKEMKKSSIDRNEQQNQRDDHNPNLSPVLPKSEEEFSISGSTSKATAVEIQTENLYHASFSSENQTVDWYCFTTSENYSAYSIEILNNSIDTTLYFTIYDAYDKELKIQSISKNNTNYLDIELDSNSTYWIAVTRSYNSRIGNYQFSVKERIRYAGTGKNTAFNVSLNSNYTKEFDVHGINDWYKFQTTQNYSTYQLTLINNSVDTTIYLTVYDEYDTQMGQVSVSKGSTSILDLKLTADKEYTIILSRYNEDRNGYYQFMVSEMICDSGLTKDEAFPLVINETLYGTADTSFDEWYFCSFSENGEYKFQLTNNSINSTLYATVYDELGTELGRISASNGVTADNSFEVTAGTTLHIAITRYNSDRFGNYTFLVTKIK